MRQVRIGTHAHNNLKLTHLYAVCLWSRSTAWVYMFDITLPSNYTEEHTGTELVHRQSLRTWLIVKKMICRSKEARSGRVLHVRWGITHVLTNSGQANMRLRCEDAREIDLSNQVSPKSSMKPKTQPKSTVVVFLMLNTLASCVPCNSTLLIISEFVI